MAAMKLLSSLMALPSGHDTDTVTLDRDWPGSSAREDMGASFGQLKITRDLRSRHLAPIGLA